MKLPNVQCPPRLLAMLQAGQTLDHPNSLPLAQACGLMFFFTTELHDITIGFTTTLALTLKETRSLFFDGFCILRKTTDFDPETGLKKFIHIHSVWRFTLKLEEFCEFDHLG